MKIEDPDGQTWRVTRRWVPWRRPRRGLPFVDGGVSGFSLPDDLMALAIAVVVGVVVLFVLPVLLFPFVVAAELLLLLLLVPFAVVSRVVFGRQWHVELRRGWTPWAEEPAGDWSSSATRIHELADRVRRGEPPARTIGATPRQR